MINHVTKSIYAIFMILKDKISTDVKAMDAEYTSDFYFQPQNSMPDVIIWMLKGGKERVAYCRIPAHELLYTPEVEERGVKCGKVIDINMKVSTQLVCNFMSG